MDVDRARQSMESTLHAMRRSHRRKVEKVRNLYPALDVAYTVMDKFDRNWGKYKYKEKKYEPSIFANGANPRVLLAHRSDKVVDSTVPILRFIRHTTDFKLQETPDEDQSGNTVRWKFGLPGQEENTLHVKCKVPSDEPDSKDRCYVVEETEYIETTTRKIVCPDDEDWSQKTAEKKGAV